MKTQILEELGNEVNESKRLVIGESELDRSANAGEKFVG